MGVVGEGVLEKKVEQGREGKEQMGRDPEKKRQDGGGGQKAM